MKSPVISCTNYLNPYRSMKLVGNVCCYTFGSQMGYHLVVGVESLNLSQGKHINFNTSSCSFIIS